VAALERLPYVDGTRMAMLGRSTGGGVTMNALVTQPGLVDAAVIYDSVSSRFLDNLEHFTRRSRPDVVRDLFDRFGTPAESPRFYRELSPRTYFHRITEPVLVHHGTADATCPPRWARTTQRLMRSAGVDSRLRWWPGEDHAFYARWQDAMDVTIRFLRTRLDL
jgi:dipeptidyl aminopeptidase/acylaminoacyl peptidase